MYAGRKEFPVFNSFFRSKLFRNAGKIRKEINMKNELSKSTCLLARENLK